MQILRLSTLLLLLAFAACKKSDDVAQPLAITKADMAASLKANGIVANNFSVNPASVTIPVRGENQTWDFSTLAETGTFSTGGSSFTSPANAAFPAATYAINGTANHTVGGVSSTSYNISYFNELSDAGLYTLGSSQNTATSATIASLGASFSFPVQNFNFEGNKKIPYIVFPAKYNDSVSFSNMVSTLNYTVTAAAFGLSNTPAQTKYTSSGSVVVMASGTANLKGIGNKRVLVVKSAYRDQNNYFLAGSPAPAVLLNQLGVTDGDITTSATYIFYAEGLGIVGAISVNNSGVISSASFRKA